MASDVPDASPNGRAPKTVYKTSARLRAQVAAYQRHHRDLGLCLYCPNPRCDDSLTCPSCRERHRQSARERTRYWREVGLCTRCGGERLDGYLRCLSHVLRDRNSKRQRRKTKNGREPLGHVSPRP